MLCGNACGLSSYTLWTIHNGVFGAPNVWNGAPIKEITCVTLYRTKTFTFFIILTHCCHAYASWIFNLYKYQFRFVRFIVRPVIIDMFRQNFRKNAQKVFKRLSNICTQHKCQINSIFVSYTLPLSQNFIYNCFSFYEHNI